MCYFERVGCKEKGSLPKISISVLGRRNRILPHRGYFQGIFTLVHGNMRRNLSCGNILYQSKILPFVIRETCAYVFTANHRRGIFGWMHCQFMAWLERVELCQSSAEFFRSNFPALFMYMVLLELCCLSHNFVCGK